MRGMYIVLMSWSCTPEFVGLQISLLLALSVATLKGSVTLGCSRITIGHPFFVQPARFTALADNGSVPAIGCGWRVSSMLFWVTAVARIERKCEHPTQPTSLNLLILLLLVGPCPEFLC